MLAEGEGLSPNFVLLAEGEGLSPNFVLLAEGEGLSPLTRQDAPSRQRLLHLCRMVVTAASFGSQRTIPWGMPRAFGARQGATDSSAARFQPRREAGAVAEQIAAQWEASQQQQVSKPVVPVMVLSPKPRWRKI